MKRTLTLATLIALGAAAYAPLPSMAETDFHVVITAAPPEPVYEPMPGPRPGYIWAPGYWEWRGHRHYWRPGTWIVARPGYAYYGPVWHERGGNWYMEPPHWRAHGRDRDHDGVPDRFERRRHDRDHDGIPDRVDRDRDNDGIPNKYDHDRDGDGVRNRRDRHPDNPYRY